MTEKVNVTLYMAVSIDGYIATKDGNSDWVSEADATFFQKEIAKAGCIIVGRKTFEQFYGDLYPIANVTNIVVSKKKHKTSNDKNVVFVSSVRRALKTAVQKKHKKVLLIGGGTINSAFLKANLIDEIILSVHSHILGEGIHLFEGYEGIVTLQYQSSKTLSEGLTQLRYRVEKK